MRYRALQATHDDRAGGIYMGELSSDQAVHFGSAVNPAREDPLSGQLESTWRRRRRNRGRDIGRDRMLRCSSLDGPKDRPVSAQGPWRLVSSRIM